MSHINPWRILSSLLVGLRVETPYLGLGAGSVSHSSSVIQEVDTPPPDLAARRLAKTKASVAEGLEQDLSYAFGEGTASCSASSPVENASEVSASPGGTVTSTSSQL